MTPAEQAALRALGARNATPAPVVTTKPVTAAPVVSTTPVSSYVPAPAVPVNSMPAAALGTNTGTYSTYFPTPTASVGLAESATASKDAYLANTAKEADQLTTDVNAGKTQIQSLMQRLGLTASEKADAYETSGLNTDKAAIDELNNQIDARTRAYDKQIETLKATNPNGALASGLANEVDALNRSKASELADLAIVLNAKTRNFDTAKSIIDQKADAETEDLKTQLQGLQYFYQENQSILSKDQQTLLSDKITQASNEYADAKAARTLVGNIQLEAAKNGAPVSVVQAIGRTGDEESAIAAAGSYLKSASGAGTFTTTQKNNGASNAGIALSAFDGLTPDDQNYFINGYDGFTSALKQVQAGTATVEDLAAAIEEAPISNAAKNILYSKAGIDPNAETASPGFFGQAFNFLGSLFGA